MTQHVVAAGAYAGMVLGVVAVVLAEWRRHRATLRVIRQLFVAWVVGATLLAGLSQRDLWPLSSWSLMTGEPTRDVGRDPLYLQLIAVDASGREFPVDYRAVEPFAFDELVAWMRAEFFTLPAAAQDSAAGYLLRRLNAARARVRAGQAPGTQARLLGPLRASFHTLHPGQWTRPGSVSAAPFTVLRIYNESWNLEERAAGAGRGVRRLLYEYREGNDP